MKVNQSGSPRFAEAGIAHLALIFIILASIALGTILVQQRTNFNPRADQWYLEDEFRNSDKSESEPEPEPESEPEPEPEQQPEPVSEPQAEEEQPPAEENPPQTEEPPAPREESQPEETTSGEEPALIEETPAEGGPEEEVVEENPTLWETIVEGTQEWVEQIADGAGQLGEDLGILSTDERIEDDLEEVAENTEIPNPVALITNKEVPEEQRQEAIRVFAESNGIDPNDPEAVNQLLIDLQLLDPPTDNVALVETQPFITLQQAGQGITSNPDLNSIPPEELAPFLDQAGRIVTQLYGADQLEGLETPRTLAALALYKGLSEEQILNKVSGNQNYFLDIMRDYVTQASDGKYYVYLSRTDRPALADIIWDIVAKNNGLDIASTSFIGDSQDEVIAQLRPYVANGLLTQALTSSSMDPLTAESRGRISRMIEYAVGNDPDGDRIRRLYDKVPGVIQEGRTIVLNEDMMAVAFYGAGRVPENYNPASLPAGFASFGQGTVTMNQQYANNQKTHDHEWIHQSAFASNPRYLDNIIRTFGDTEEDVILARMLIEGTTETAAVLASHLDSDEPAWIAYRETVDDIQGQIVQRMLNNGYTVDEAYSFVARAALTGDYERFFNAVHYSKDAKITNLWGDGAKTVRQILRDEYRNKNGGVTDEDPDPREGTSNPEGSLLFDDLFELLPHHTTYAQEGFSIFKDDFSKIAAVNNWDQAIAMGQAITESEKRNISPLNTNSKNQVLIVNQINKQKPVVVSSNLFELDSKVNITSNMNTQYGELSKEYTKSILSSSLLNPKIIKEGNTYKLQTGRVGAVKGKIDRKTYKVKVRPMGGYNLSLPESINPGKNSILAIGVTPGNGSVKYLKKKSSFKLNLPFTAFAAEGSLTAAFYNDKNGNGKWDRNENALPWAGATLELTGQNSTNPSENSSFSVNEIPFFKIQLGPEK